MLAIGRLAIHVLVPGAVLFAVMADCGGKTGAPRVAARAPAVHRVEALSCVGVHSPAQPTNIMYPESSSCTTHADCTAGVNGKCIQGGGSAGGMYYCTYDQCATDADCESGKICYCTADTAARCLTVGNCQSDADCGGGGYSYCSPSTGRDCGGYHSIDGFHCHTAKDTCMDDADCTGTDYCNFDTYEGRWKCTAIDKTCIIG
jgi:hypothetical protein